MHKNMTAAEALKYAENCIANGRTVLEVLPQSRERSLVQTKLDEAQLWLGQVEILAHS